MDRFHGMRRLAWRIRIKLGHRRTSIPDISRRLRAHGITFSRTISSTVITIEPYSTENVARIREAIAPLDLDIIEETRPRPHRLPHRDLEVRLVLDSGVITTRTVTFAYRVINASQASVMIGADYGFEEWVGAEWRPVRFPSDWGFPSVGFRLEPGDTEELMARIPPSGLSPGVCRMVKGFGVLEPGAVTISRPAKPNRIYCEFTVQAP